MGLPKFNEYGLLPDGVHQTTLAEFKERFVEEFSDSDRRDKVCTGLVRYQNDIETSGVHATQWIDGSFIDQTRAQPEDVDLVNFCDSANINSVDARIRSQVTDLLVGGESTKAAYHTHTFLVVRFPPGHKYEARFEAMRKYWRDWFAVPQDYSQTHKTPAPWRGSKGIVQMSVGDANLCPFVSDERA